MTFDLIIYSKIKENYKDNIRAFDELSRNTDKKKLSFKKESGRFQVESNFSRTISLGNKEGTTASSRDGFLYPIAALCHRVCHKGLKTRKDKKKYIEDLQTIMNGLTKLEAIYNRQFFKGSQKENVALAKAACQNQLNILSEVKKPDDNSLVLRCHKAFLDLVQIDLRRFENDFLDLFSFVKTNLEFRRSIVDIVKDPKYKEKMRESDDDSNSIKYLNPEFLKATIGASRSLYSAIYAAAKENTEDNIKKDQYFKEMQSIKNAAFEFGVHYRNPKWQYNHPSEDFLYFEKSPGVTAEHRIYLNVKPNFEAHKKVLKCLLPIIGNPRFQNYVGSFKFAYLGTIRPDAVCIYGRDARKLQELAQSINGSEIARYLNPQVASMQRLLFPGIGTGEEPAPWQIKDSNDKEKKWSYGSHRCFLVTWALIRARRDNITARDPDFDSNVIFYLAEVFGDNGIHLETMHTATIRFQSTLVGTLVTNLAKQKPDIVRKAF